MINLKVLDLYCGAGGLGYGFEMTGAYNVVGGIDIYEPALKSFYHNHKCSIEIAERYGRPTNLSDDKVRQQVIDDFCGVEVVIGGPPCQGFSVAGRRLTDYLEDERNHQVFNFLDVVEGISPKAFVMENVRGITTTGQKDKNSILNQLITRIEEMGYRVSWRVLSAEDYYVPQKRRRMFLVGVKYQYETFKFPDAQCANKDDLFSNRRRFTTVREAIADLPYPNDGDFLEYDQEAQGWFQRLMRMGSTGIDGHSVTKHSQDFIVKLSEQKLGSKLYPNWNHSWVKFHPDEIAPTIKENHRAPGVHYERPMCISPRECARLQAMPDAFALKGNKTQRLVQVGNAVPPLLAAAVATNLAAALGVNVRNPFGIPVKILED